jgi:hypothetical protein
VQKYRKQQTTDYMFAICQKTGKQCTPSKRQIGDEQMTKRFGVFIRKLPDTEHQQNTG